MLVDTSILVSLFNESDSHHLIVRKFIYQALLRKKSLEVADTVYEELLAILRKRIGKTYAVRAARSLTQLPIIQLVETDNELLLAATDIFLKNAAKYSYVDVPW